MSQKLIKMATDLFAWHKKPETMQFSNTSVKSLEEAEVLFRKTIFEECGVEEGKFDWKAYSNPITKWKLFNLTVEMIDAIVPNILKAQFDPFTEVKNAAWNEQLIFKVNSPDFFRVDKVANGNTNVRGQRLDKRAIRLYPVMRSVKVQESLYRLLAGEVDWATYVNRVAESFANEIKTDVYNAIYNSYDNTNDSAHFMSGTFAAATFNSLVSQVQAENGNLKPIAFGTKLALAKLYPGAGYMSYNMMDAYNMSGYIGEFQGTKLVELEQAIDPTTGATAINDSFLLVIPSGSDKIVKLGFEGSAIITENTNDLPVDQTIEYNFQKSYDVQVLAAGRYGIYRVS
jgi:hypothetical protein